MSKTIQTRIQNKHDIEANWNLATNFAPLAGEIIIYDPDENYDFPRFKIGKFKEENGEQVLTKLNELPFVTSLSWESF